MLHQAARNILLVEDSLVESELLRRTLAGNGYRVTLAHNGQEALEAVRTAPPDLVMTDIRMPIMDGYELCRTIKRDPALAHIPVILLSVLSEPEDIIQAIDARADSYTTKPYSEANLLGRLSSLLSTPSRSQREPGGPLVVEYRDKVFHIDADPQQMLNLLLSVYENTMAQNQELMAVQAQLSQLNENLEEMVRQRTAALQESHARIQRLVESNIIGILMWDAEGRITEVNDAFLCMLGYDQDDVASGRLNWKEITPPEWLDRDEQIWLPEQRKTGRLPPFEKEYFHKDGHRVPVLIGVAPFADAKELEGVAFVLDLSERRRAETERLARQSAEAANRAKSDFLANMSHEIRTPMNAILGMSHLALQSGLTPRQHNYVQKVHASAESLLGIINDILDFSKIEAGKLDIEHVNFNLADVLDNLANVVGMKAEEKNLELLYLEPPDLPVALVGDPLRLSQALLNLANNAVKFTDQGEVSLALQIVQRGDDWIDLRFEVRDTGIGIEPAQRERLFQPFEQADTSTSRRHGGTGLGLAISRQLVHLMGGQLEMLSTPGRGSRFFFTLRFPLQQEFSRQAPLRHEGLLGSRTLVVDDNAQARELLLAMAQALGLQPDEAADGIEALRKIGDAQAGAEPYDLVLLDWKMPGMDGITCAQHIHDMARDLTRPGARSPTVLMLTAFSRDEALTRVEEQGVLITALLTKPVTQSSLFDACCKALGLASLASVHAERRKGALTTDHRSTLNGARILLVEDNEINREVALELLTEEGITVVTAANGREALQVLERECFDAVLMDCQMPVMDGFAATRALRERPALQDLPVIAMTANAMVGDRERAIAAGMNDHIAKPINVDEMFATLARWLAPRRQTA
ncbi:response regulator [Ideonella sp. YS5]|uniref:response regulator n=1 Tax=Ideonella sp. YS5 TaxID=3453714 RepID=UPI003EEA148E